MTERGGGGGGEGGAWMRREGAGEGGNFSVSTIDAPCGSMNKSSWLPFTVHGVQNALWAVWGAGEGDGCSQYLPVPNVYP